jgi:hypothetical protein
LTVIYAGMVAEENKENAILKKKDKTTWNASIVD